MEHMRRATLTDERTTFIIGDRAAFASLATSRRAVVLTTTSSISRTRNSAR